MLAGFAALLVSACNVDQSAQPPPDGPGALPDLTINIGGVSGDGSTVTLNFTVTNKGAADAQPFWVDGWEDLPSPPSLGPSLVGKAYTHFSSGLAAGTTQSGALQMPSTLLAGTAYVSVDTNQEVAESDESSASNIDSITWDDTKPDLIITVDSVQSDGSNVTVFYTVTNQGLAAAGDFWVDVWDHLDTAPVLDPTLAGIAFARYIGGLSPGASFSDSQTFASTRLFGTAYATVDTNLEVPESNEDNNIASLAWNNDADLTITIDNVVVIGSTFTVYYTITNQGTADASAFYVDVWDHLASPPVPDASLVGVGFTLYGSGLAAGSSLSDSITITTALELGTAYATVDTNTDVVESDETNNVASYPWDNRKPDLVVSINNVAADGSTLTVDYTVTNQGPVAAGPFYVDVWDHLGSPPTPSPTLAGPGYVQYTSGLAAGASDSGSITIDSALTSGTAYATVDTNLEVDESNEDNNVASRAWVASLADLVISNFAIPKSGPQTNGYTHVSATVRNQGNHAAGPFYVTYFLSSDTTLDAGDTEIDWCSVSSLAINASYTCSMDIFIPNDIANGRWYVLAYADDLGQVVESSEANNSRNNPFAFYNFPGCNFAIADLGEAWCWISFTGWPAGAMALGVDTYFSTIYPRAEDLVVELRYEVSPGFYQIYTLWNHDGVGYMDPFEYTTGIFDFSSQTVNGVWYLWVRDTVSGGSGNLDGWWLRVFY